jgi:outer membrane protein assembly factor BamB
MHWLACLIGLAFLQTARADNWPGFRGPGGQGISPERGLPVHWSATENVAWKTPIPGEGYSSPIVWGKQLFITSATDKGRSCHVICLDAETGQVRWDREVFQQELRRKQPNNSYASPTPVTDGQRVFAVFNDGSIAAVSVDGKPSWTYREIKFFSEHGLGASPILYKDLVIMPYDGSSSGPDKYVGWQKPWEEAVIVALDKKTGQVRWKAHRGLSRIAHVSPIVVNVGGRDVLISGAGDVIQGFDPNDGKRLWSVRSEGEGVVPTPVSGDGLVFALSGFGAPTLRAVRLEGGSGGTREIAWESKKAVSTIPSAIYVKPYLYEITEKGVAYCLEAATGKIIGQERLQGNTWASPVYADGKLYCLAEDGTTTVLEAGPQLQVIARNSLGEPCRASIAIANHRLYLRSNRHVFCIRAPDNTKADR